MFFFKNLRITAMTVAMAFFTIFSWNPAFSEENSAVSLGKVVVTSESNSNNLTYETGDVPVDEISGFNQVITREKFEGKMTDLAEVIEKEAGIQIRKSGGLGSFSTVSIRGSTTEQVLIFIDGVLLNEASGGGVDLSNISLSDVEAIEIYRGTTPLQFGTSSIGGAINIRTRRTGKKKLIASATAGYGSFKTARGGFFLNSKPGNFDYLASADFLGSKGDFTYENKNGQMDSEENYETEKRKNNQFYQYNLLGKAGYNFTKDVRLYVSNEFFSKQQALPYWNNSDIVNTSLTTHRDIAITKFIADRLTSLNINSATRIQYSWKKELYDDSAFPNGSIGLGRQKSEYFTENYGFNQLFELPLPYNLITAVADVKYEKFRVNNLIDDETYRPSWRSTTSGALEDNIMLFKERISLIPCIRYHYVKDKLQSGGFTEKSTEEKSYFTPKFGMLIKPFKWLRIKANWGKYVREPSFLELFGDRGFFNGNSDLRAEKGINKDIGIESDFNFNENPFIQRIKVELAYFQSDIEDLIVFIYDARGVGKAENLSDAEIKGIETSMSLSFLKWFSLSFNYTRQNAIGKSEMDYADNKKLPGRYEHSFTGRFEFIQSFGKIYIENHRESGLYYDEAELLKSVPKNEYNAGMTLRLSRFTFTLEVKNITNDDYEDFHGYPQPGRAYYGTLKADF